MLEAMSHHLHESLHVVDFGLVQLERCLYKAHIWRSLVGWRARHLLPNTLELVVGKGLVRLEAVQDVQRQDYRQQS